jgi:chromosomal replication initiation ATPase DnaA
VSAALLERGVGGSGLPSIPATRGSVDVIIRVVADDFELTRKEMLSLDRTAHMVQARHVSMWLARRLTGLSFPRIGDQFGHRDHTTIMHGCSRIDGLMLRDAVVSERVIRLMSAITEGMAAETSPAAAPKMVPRQPSMDTIIRIAAGSFQVTERDILSYRSDASSMRARHVAMWLARRLTKASVAAIGRRFGRRARSVAYAIERIDTTMESDAEVGQLVLGLMDCLTLPPVAA